MTITVKELIDKAKQQLGSEYKLSLQLNVPASMISNWKSGYRTCSPTDRARIAFFAQEDAVKVLIESIVEYNGDSFKGKQLRQMFCKSSSSSSKECVMA